jgi:hypothetical protein
MVYAMTAEKPKSIKKDMIFPLAVFDWQVFAAMSGCSAFSVPSNDR